MKGVTAHAVREHMDRIVADERFSNADRMCRFLRFTVESRLDGREEQVKEYILGREVFDRTDSYDPRLDPIVRVEARRLRAKLSEYYAGPGRDEPLRIDYPKGTYLPVIIVRADEDAATADGSNTTRRRPGIAASAVIALVAIAVAVVLFALRTAPKDSVVAVIPVRWITDDATTLDPADTALAEAVDTDLANRNVAHVIAWPAMLPYATGRPTMRAIASSIGATTLIVISVRRESPLRTTVFLIDAASGQKRRAATYFSAGLSTFASQQALARHIVGDLSATLARGRP